MGTLTRLVLPLAIVVILFSSVPFIPADLNQPGLAQFVDSYGMYNSVTAGSSVVGQAGSNPITPPNGSGGIFDGYRPPLGQTTQGSAVRPAGGSIQTGLDTGITIVGSGVGLGQSLTGGNVQISIPVQPPIHSAQPVSPVTAPVEEPVSPAQPLTPPVAPVQPIHTSVPPVEPVTSPVIPVVPVSPVQQIKPVAPSAPAQPVTPPQQPALPPGGSSVGTIIPPAQPNTAGGAGTVTIPTHIVGYISQSATISVVSVEGGVSTNHSVLGYVNAAQVSLVQKNATDIQVTVANPNLRYDNAFVQRQAGTNLTGRQVGAISASDLAAQIELHRSSPLDNGVVQLPQGTVILPPPVAKKSLLDIIVSNVAQTIANLFGGGNSDGGNGVSVAPPPPTSDTHGGCVYQRTDGSPETTYNVAVSGGSGGGTTASGNTTGGGKAGFCSNAGCDSGFKCQLDLEGEDVRVFCTRVDPANPAHCLEVAGKTGTGVFMTEHRPTCSCHPSDSIPSVNPGPTVNAICPNTKVDKTTTADVKVSGSQSVTITRGKSDLGCRDSKTTCALTDVNVVGNTGGTRGGVDVAANNSPTSHVTYIAHINVCTTVCSNVQVPRETKDDFINRVQAAHDDLYLGLFGSLCSQAKDSAPAADPAATCATIKCTAEGKICPACGETKTVSVDCSTGAHPPTFTQTGGDPQYSNSVKLTMTMQATLPVTVEATAGCGVKAPQTPGGTPPPNGGGTDTGNGNASGGGGGGSGGATSPFSVLNSVVHTIASTLNPFRFFTQSTTVALKAGDVCGSVGNPDASGFVCPANPNCPATTHCAKLKAASDIGNACTCQANSVASTPTVPTTPTKPDGNCGPLTVADGSSVESLQGAAANELRALKAQDPNLIAGQQAIYAKYQAKLLCDGASANACNANQKCAPYVDMVNGEVTAKCACGGGSGATGASTGATSGGSIPPPPEPPVGSNPSGSSGPTGPVVPPPPVTPPATPSTPTAGGTTTPPPPPPPVVSPPPAAPLAPPTAQPEKPKPIACAVAASTVNQIAHEVFPAPVYHFLAGIFGAQNIDQPAKKCVEGGTCSNDKVCSTADNCSCGAEPATNSTPTTTPTEPAKPVTQCKSPTNKAVIESSALKTKADAASGLITEQEAEDTYSQLEKQIICEDVVNACTASKCTPQLKGVCKNGFCQAGAVEAACTCGLSSGSTPSAGGGTTIPPPIKPTSTPPVASSPAICKYTYKYRVEIWTAVNCGGCGPYKPAGENTGAETIDSYLNRATNAGTRGNVTVDHHHISDYNNTDSPLGSTPTYRVTMYKIADSSNDASCPPGKTVVGKPANPNSFGEIADAITSLFQANQ